MTPSTAPPSGTGSPPPVMPRSVRTWFAVGAIGGLAYLVSTIVTSRAQRPGW